MGNQEDDKQSIPWGCVGAILAAILTGIFLLISVGKIQPEDLRRLISPRVVRVGALTTDGFNAAGIPQDTLDTLRKLYNAGEEIKQVVFTSDSEGWVILRGWNGYQTKGVTTTLTAKLKELHNEKVEIKQVAIGPRSEWVILVEQNVCWVMATPPDLFDTLKEFYDAGREIKQVVFVGSGWIVLADKNSYAASIPDEELGDYQSLLDKLREYFDTGQAIKQIATKAPPNPFWIILTEGGYYGRGPQTLSDTLGEFSTAGCEIRNVAFSGSQGWIVLRGPCRSK